MPKTKASEKFEFDSNFQWEILKYTIRDKNGYKALMLYRPNYFSLLHQQVIARALHNFFKIKKRIPSGYSVLNEEIKKLFKSRDYATTLLETDRERIKKRVRSLYKATLKDGEDILEQCKLFASFVELKGTLENIDLTNFSQYSTYAKKIQKAVNIGLQLDEKRGNFIVAAHRSRFIDRHNRPSVTPTPYHQINRLTNAGGFEKGALIVIMDQPKKGKTFMLVNFAKAYMGRRGKVQNKKVVYFDFENGETSISTRLDQSVGNLSKHQVLSGEFDKQLSKTYRAWSRLGGEVYVIRLAALSTTDDCQKILDDMYQDYGIRFEVAIFDYVGLMGSLSGHKEDFSRISDAYVDVKNFSKKNDFDLVITGHHIVRGAYKRRATKYLPEDIAKCIDIPRHIDALFGIQQNEEEFSAGIMRLELLEQRDGLPSGRAIFNYSLKTQRMNELNDADLKKYQAAFSNHELSEDERAERNKRKDTLKSDI
jgi:KaiC/GvpD/RAD55 family RecA-like ATPase